MRGKGTNTQEEREREKGAEDRLKTSCGWFWQLGKRAPGSRRGGKETTRLELFGKKLTFSSRGEKKGASCPRMVDKKLEKKTITLGGFRDVCLGVKGRQEKWDKVMPQKFKKNPGRTSQKFEAQIRGGGGDEQEVGWEKIGGLTSLGRSKKKTLQDLCG